MKNKLSDLVIKKVYSATTMYSDGASKGDRTNRPSWAVVIKYEGETIYSQEKEIFISNISNMVILPKGSTYEWSCTEAGHFAIIEFECDAEDNQIYSFAVKNNEKILKIFKSLEYKRLLKQPLYEMESIKDVYSIILKLLSSEQDAYVPHSKEHMLSPAVDYISKNYDKKVKNEYLASLTGLSTVYFRKLFTEVYGASPMNYIKNIRIKKAKEMLRSDYGNITDVGLSLGYADIYDFSRDFKKHTGVSPSNFTKKHK